MKAQNISRLTRAAHERWFVVPERFPAKIIDMYFMNDDTKMSPKVIARLQSSQDGGRSIEGPTKHSPKC